MGKELPRYKVVTDYEKEMKDGYGSMLHFCFNNILEILKEDVPKSKENKRTSGADSGKSS